jgi:hypothetical protein
MSSTANTLVKRLVLSATLAGIVAGIAFLLVARGGTTPQSATVVRPWQRLPAAPVNFDQPSTSVWTGKKLILFGRRNLTALDSRGAPYVVKSIDVAEAYDPASQKWTRLDPSPGPGYEPTYNAVWTGKNALVFAPFRSLAYDPATRMWTSLRKSVGGGLVVWTGREAIGWGGGCCGDAWGNGLAYNPATDTYRELAPSPLAPSQGPVGAWTGRELVLFSSGFNPGTAKPYPASLARGAAYNPATDTWRRITPQPSSELGFTGAAAWDGHEVLIAGNGRSAQAAFAYDPATNQRRALAPMPLGLRNARAFWTGDRLLVWGGSEAGRGLAYDPRTDRWSMLPAAPLPGVPEALAWTGRSLIVGSGVHMAAFTPPR